MKEELIRNCINSKEYFKEKVVNVICHEKDQISYICLDDLCTILKRANMINTGQAMRLCPSAIKHSIRKNGRELWFIKPFDVHRLLQSIRKESKLISTLCDELQQWVNELPLEQAVTPIKQTGVQLNIEPVTFNYQDQPITFKAENGITYVNATQMAKTFNKNPREWLLLAETYRLRQSLVEKRKSVSFESQILTVRGQQGSTWIQEDLAIAFSQWLSPEFSQWCNNHIKQLMTKGFAVLPNENESDRYSFDPQNPEQKLPLPNNLKDALQFMLQQQDVIERQHKQLESNKPKVDYYDNFIEQREWFKTSFIAEELQTSTTVLHRFLSEQGICKYDPRKKQWTVYPSHTALQCQVPYLWTNKQGRTYGYGTTPRWTHAGRDFILELWGDKN